MNNAVERIQAFDAGRDPRLLQMKYKLMQHDVFAFYRGTCHLFYQDWPADSPLNAAPSAWLCGDLHLQNFGSYKGDNRLVYIDINDFDESVLALYLGFSPLARQFAGRRPGYENSRSKGPDAL